MSVQTKEVPSALQHLLKAKGQRPSGTVQQPVGVVIENQNVEVPATPAPAPEELVDDSTKSTPATPEQNPEPSDNRNYEQAWKELKQHHDKLAFELRSENKQLKDQLTEATVKKITPPKTKEEMEEFKKQNPEAFDIMRSVALETVGEDNVALKARLEEVNRLTSELKEKEAFKRLLEIHPDAMEIRKSTEFAKWFNEQPEDIKRILASSTDITAVAKQLTLYKIEMGIDTSKDKKKADSKKREEASIGVDVKSRTEILPQKKIWTKTEIDMVCADYAKWNKHKDEIDQARREGRVDMSK